MTLFWHSRWANLLIPNLKFVHDNCWRVLQSWMNRRRAWWHLLRLLPFVGWVCHPLCTLLSLLSLLCYYLYNEMIQYFHFHPFAATGVRVSQTLSFLPSQFKTQMTLELERERTSSLVSRMKLKRRAGEREEVKERNWLIANDEWHDGRRRERIFLLTITAVASRTHLTFKS